MNPRGLPAILDRRSPHVGRAATFDQIRKTPMMRPLPIAASLVLCLAAFAAPAQDAPAAPVGNWRTR